VNLLPGECQPLFTYRHGGYVGSEFVNRSSCPPTVPMFDDAVDFDHPHLAPVRWMKAVTDKLDVLWSAVNRNMAMSVAGEGEGENSVICRSGVRPHQVLCMMNNVQSVRTSEAVDTVQPRRRVWRLE